jgi:exopolysaccharide biosynthesis polyprenyl glycosylphosphotransferase
MIAASVFCIVAAAVLLLSMALSSRSSCGGRVLVIGSGPLAGQIVAEARRRNGRRSSAAVVDDGNEPEPALVSLVAGSLDKLGSIISELQPDRIVITLTERRGRLPLGELLQARIDGVLIEEGVDYYERLTGKIAIEALTPSVLIASRDFRKSHLDLVFGHALSLVVSLAGLALLSPLFALIAVAIKLDSPGPIFFVHDRVGLHGRRMKLFKFRTMHPADGPTSEWVCDNGHRITRVGYWLRKFRIDELPQLLNVLRGELNLVGPRPHPQSNFELFSKEIPYYSLRLAVRPGLTGWAQVRQGYANGLDEEIEKMRHDLYYIKHMSAWLDLRILLRTIWTVLAGEKRVSSVGSPLPATSSRRPRIVGVRVAH